MKKLSFKEILEELPSNSSMVTAEAIHGIIFDQHADPAGLQKWLQLEGISGEGNTTVCDRIFAAMKSGTSGTQPAQRSGHHVTKSALLVVLLLMVAQTVVVGLGIYTSRDISGQVETLQKEVANLRSFFYTTQVQRKDEKGKLLWKCQKDKNGEVIRYADNRCLLSEEPIVDEFPPQINGLISKAIEERALSAVDLVVQTRLGDFLAVLERGKTDPASVPDGGLATLDECLAVADGGSLPQAAACCARTPILTQTSCRMAIRCKLDTMAPPEICPRK